MEMRGKFCPITALTHIKTIHILHPAFEAGLILICCLAVSRREEPEQGKALTDDRRCIIRAG